MPKIEYIEENLDSEGNARPRFKPSQKLVKLGYTRQNLKHLNGEWYTLGEALDFSNKIKLEASFKTSTLQAAFKKRKAPIIYTLEGLMNDWQSPGKNPKFANHEIVQGKRNQKPLAAKTIKFYKHNIAIIAQECPHAWTSSVKALDQTICYGMYEHMWSKRGLATARAAMSTLSAAISWGMKRGKCNFPANPAKQLGMETPLPRVRSGTIEEVDALIKAADTLGLPEIGDMISLAVWSGQRQGDRLAMEKQGILNDYIYLRISKTGVVACLPYAPALKKRLEASAERRAAAGIINPRLILNETSWKPFNTRWYISKYTQVRTQAAKEIKSVSTLTDQDLRDTAVTWLAMAGCSIPEICSITKHNLESATRILRHYLDLNAGMANTAIGKMVAWHDQAKENL